MWKCKEIPVSQKGILPGELFYIIGKCKALFFDMRSCPDVFYIKGKCEALSFNIKDAPRLFRRAP